MLFGDRPDGTRIPNLAPIRKVMAHVIPSSNGGAIYHEMILDLTKTLPWLKEMAQTQGREVTLFHLVLHAAATTLHRRPELHRFVAGSRLWQRRRCELSFAVKKRLSDDAKMTAVKVGFEPTDTLMDVVQRADGGIGIGRGEKETTSEKETALATRLPFFMLGWLIGFQKFLDRWNLLPASLIDPDPLYASAFLANLGSVGLDAPWHHLYDYGTVPIFLVVGKIHKRAFVTEDNQLEVRDAVVIRATFDERIADGLYCAKSLEITRGIIEDPAANAVL
jgi:hypothetical protein